MMNNDLNLPVDDMKITSIIKSLKSQLKSSISMSDFKKVMIELDNIQDDNLSEYDDMIADIYNSVSKKCDTQIRYFLTDPTMVNGQTFGDLMKQIIDIG